MYKKFQKYTNKINNKIKYLRTLIFLNNNNNRFKANKSQRGRGCALMWKDDLISLFL